MPLAVEHGVSSIMTETMTDSGYMYEAFYMNGHIGFDDDQIHAHMLHSTLDKNPLRAIVICLIKVLEAKNES